MKSLCVANCGPARSLAWRAWKLNQLSQVCINPVGTRLNQSSFLLLLALILWTTLWHFLTKGSSLPRTIEFCDGPAKRTKERTRGGQTRTEHNLRNWGASVVPINCYVRWMENKVASSQKWEVLTTTIFRFHSKLHGNRMNKISAGNL